MTIKKCRLCGSENYKTILDLGEIYVSTFVEEPDKKTPKAPLELIECQDCTLLQLKHTAPMELMYSGHYWYKSGMNKAIRDDLEQIAKIGKKHVKKEDKWLDIGANDGTLLKFVGDSCKTIGVEPASNLVTELSSNADVTINGFWEYERYSDLVSNAKVITAIGMFYDLEEPNTFVADIKKALAKDGVFIAQLMTLKPMIEKADLGNICHEHLEYYSYKTLVKLYEDNGLEIYKVEENNINGGSYRLFARHYKNGSIEYKEPVWDYDEFAKRIKDNKEKTVTFLKQEVKKGKKIYGYGASTKGNTIMQYYGIDRSLIQGIADKDTEKLRKYTVATKIPIVSEKVARRKADYFFVLPWGFIETFKEREEAWQKKGGKFIVSIPNFEIYG